jgi:glucose/arabinose dehydrogenase
MNLLYSAFVVCLFSQSLFSQSFKRSELPTSLSTPWELTFGPDNYLWVTEFGGKVSRVDPSTGTETVVYVAPDYYGGGINEQSIFCTFPNIGSGTLGLALHPDFLILGNSYIYYLYSYNSGTIVKAKTRCT